MAISDRRLGRGLLTAFCAVAAVGCSFPEHTFIEDSQFYGSDASTGATGGGATGGQAGAGGTGAGGTGAGGSGGGVGGTAGTGATGGLAGAGGTGAGGTGGGTGNEDCTNGNDDDGDNKIDCADEDCQGGYTCAPIPPSGWTGPVALYEGSTAAPDCLTSGGYPTLKQNASSGLNAGTPTCPSCTCDPPTGGGACTAELVFFPTGACGGTTCWGNGGGICTGQPISLTSGAGCQLIPTLLHNPPNVPMGVMFANVQATGGTCNAKSTGTKNIPTPTWSQNVRACGDGPGGGKGCGSGVCLPKPATPFSSSLCVFKTGDTTCPAGAYAKKSLSYLSFSDNRDCAACSCGLSAGGTCSSPTVDIFTNDFCSADKQTMTSAQTCTALTTDPTPAPPPGSQAGDTRSAMFSATPTGGTCPPSGGSVTGSVTPTQAITFCCL